MTRVKHAIEFAGSLVMCDDDVPDGECALRCEAALTIRDQHAEIERLSDEAARWRWVEKCLQAVYCRSSDETILCVWSDKLTAECRTFPGRGTVEQLVDAAIAKEKTDGKA